VSNYIPAPDAGSPKPGKIQAIAIMTIINGALNILWGAGVSFGMLFGLVTIICIPVTILPAILGIFEILYGVKLLATPPRPVQPSQTLAILEICCIIVGNVPSMVIGILALVFYNEPDVRAYFAQLNGYIATP
jgi:hypothetical protein